MAHTGQNDSICIHVPESARALIEMAMDAKDSIIEAVAIIISKFPLSKSVQEHIKGVLDGTVFVQYVAGATEWSVQQLEHFSEKEFTHKAADDRHMADKDKTQSGMTTAEERSDERALHTAHVSDMMAADARIKVGEERLHVEREIGRASCRERV